MSTCSLLLLPTELLEHILRFVLPLDLYSVERTSLVLHNMLRQNRHYKYIPSHEPCSSGACETCKRRALSSIVPTVSNLESSSTSGAATLTRSGCSIVEGPNSVRIKYSTGRFPPFADQEGFELFPYRTEYSGLSPGGVLRGTGRFWDSFCNLPATVPCQPRITIGVVGQNNVLQVVARNGHAVTVTDIAFALCEYSVSAIDNAFLFPTSAGGSAFAGLEWTCGSNFLFKKTWSQQRALFWPTADYGRTGRRTLTWTHPRLEHGNPRNGPWPHRELSISGICQ